jgi:hypothetical protein
MSTNTQYGFTWGPMDVVRYMEYRGRRVLGVETNGKRRLEVAVSPKGNNIRVWLDGKELLPTTERDEEGGR